MTDNVRELTVEEQILMKEFRAKGKKFALAVDNINPDQAMLAIRRLYVSADIKPPLLGFVFRSPYECLLARKVMQSFGTLKIGEMLTDEIDINMKAKPKKTSVDSPLLSDPKRKYFFDQFRKMHDIFKPEYVSPVNNL